MLRFYIDLGMVRGGRGPRSRPLGVDSGPGEGGSEGVPGAPNPINKNMFSRPDVSRATLSGSIVRDWFWERSLVAVGGNAVLGSYGGREIITERDPMRSCGLRPWLSPKHANLHGLVTSIAPNPIISWGPAQRLLRKHRYLRVTRVSLARGR